MADTDRSRSRSAAGRLATLVWLLSSPLVAGGTAAPGYLPDAECASCHREIADSYREVGMSQSFFRPRPERMIEDFAAPPFLHQASGRIYEMRREDDSVVFYRYQLDAAGERINQVRLVVDWVLGSGHHSRTYLVHAPGGELYQLPVAWYTQTASWGMAPGYDRPDHEGLGRRVRRECMFCHNAYPDVPPGSDTYGTAQVFPAELPEGTGCQRCHGPGAEHAARASMGAVVAGAATGIVNPARLEPALRDDICYGCHMQPSVALFGPRRFDRGDYSFRPGEPLADYVLKVDVDQQSRTRGERFEINHHPYRLQQSRCFVESAGALSCLTCHDPHRKVPTTERAEHYRRACLGCHEAASVHTGEPAAQADCVACHMPARRTQDVVHVTMTDHRIGIYQGRQALTAPLAEYEPVLLAVELLDRRRVPPEPLATIYRAVAVLRTGTANREAVDTLDRLLADDGAPRAPEPRLDLARGLLRLHEFDQAAERLGQLVSGGQPPPLALEWLAIARAGRGENEEAIALLRRALRVDPQRTEARYNLARLLAGTGHPLDAEATLRQVLEARPEMPEAWALLGQVLETLDRPAEAADAYRRSLAAEPRQESPYLNLARLLASAGDRAQARRYLEHGARWGSRTDRIAARLEELDGSRSPSSPW